MKRPKLETEKLILRSFKLSDAGRVRALAGDRMIADKMLNVPHPYEEGMAEEWISTHESKFGKGESIHFAIILKFKKELIGAIGLNIDKSNNKAELGYWIGKNYWNKGFCTEAAKAVLDYGFEQLNLNKIKASHFAGNPASGKVMCKIGMKKEGYRKEHVIKLDKYVDLVSYAILKREWRENEK